MSQDVWVLVTLKKKESVDVVKDQEICAGPDFYDENAFGVTVDLKKLLEKYPDAKEIRFGYW